MSADLRIDDGRVLDGTGAPWFRGHVHVADGEITAVTRGDDRRPADRVLDADGDVVCPGFVDVHSHSDLELFADPALAPKVRQGITTEVLGQDGFSMAPLGPDADPGPWRRHLSGLAGDPDREWDWRSLAGYLDAIDEAGVGPNVATLVGHGTVRYAVLGMDDRAPDEAELERMADLVTEALDDGAVGLSTGLVYSPQINASTAEVRALASRLGPTGRPFVAHIRNERRHVWRALDEFVDVGASEGVPLHLSHFKLPGELLHGEGERARAVVETARERGVDLTADQYPYRAGSTMLSNLLPPWVHAGGPEATMARLRDPEARERLRRDIHEWRLDDWENRGPYTGWDNVVVTSVDAPENEAIEGLSVAEIATRREVDPVDAVCDVLLAEELGVSMILHQLDEADVRTIMGSELVTFGTDGLFGGRPHPRVHGTYPRILGRYVREETVLSLAEAVRKATSLAARAMGLSRKGLLRPGMDADVVVFDPVAVEARATYDEPTRPPAGISDVFVGGEAVVAGGEPTGATPGETIRA